MRTFLNQFSWAELVRSNVETILALHDGFLDDSWGKDICPKIIFLPKLYHLLLMHFLTIIL